MLGGETLTNAMFFGGKQTDLDKPVKDERRGHPDPELEVCCREPLSILRLFSAMSSRPVYATHRGCMQTTDAVH